MADEFAKLAILIEANTKSYERAMVRLQQQTDQAIRKAGSSVDSLDSKLGNLSVTAANFAKGFAIGAISAGVAVLAKMATSAIASAAAIGDLADKTGISIAAIQELQYAGAAANVSFDDLSGGIVKFTRNLAQAQNGTGKLAEIFNRAGVSLTDINGKAKDVNTALLDFADIVHKAGDEQDKLNMVIDAFGKGNSDWVLMFDKGADGMLHMRDAAHQVGMVLTDEVIRNAQRFDDAWQQALLSVEQHMKSWVVQALAATAQVAAAVQNSGRGGGRMQGGLSVPPGAIPTPTRPENMRPGGPQIGGTESLFPIPLPQPKPENWQDIVAGNAEAQAREQERHLREVQRLQKEAGDAAKYWSDQMEKTLDTTREVTEQVSFFGNAGIDAFEQLARNGAKVSDVIKDLTWQLLKATMQALLLGQGPLAGMFGTAANQPGGGGMLGGMFGVKQHARGGQMRKGFPALVGEHGPELVVPGNNAYAVPNSGMGGGGDVNVTVINNSDATVRPGKMSRSGDNRQLEIMVDKATTRNGSDPTSGTSKMLGIRAASIPRVRR